MATLVFEKRKESFRIEFTQFAAGKRRRRALYLGKVSRETGEWWAKFLPEIIEVAGIDYETASRDQRKFCERVSATIAGTSPAMQAKLAALGLIELDEPDRIPEAAPVLTIDGLIAMYIDRATGKASTKITYERARKRLVKFFGADKPVAEITRLEATDFKRWLEKQRKPENDKAGKRNGKLSPASIGRMIGVCKQFFRWAVDHELIAKSPFATLKAGDQKNEARKAYIDRQTIDRVIAVCPSIEWKLIFALSRLAGLRTPSETLLLKWGDVDFAGDKLLVTSPKTEHHKGKGSRVVPLLPALKELLLEARELADDHDPKNPAVAFVIRRLRQTGNWRTTAEKIVARAGVVRWPKLFVNLRASFATDMASVVSPAAAAAFLGHSVAVAEGHYWQATPSDFDKAVAAMKAIEAPPPKRCDNEPPVEGDLGMQLGRQWAVTLSDSEDQESKSATPKDGRFVAFSGVCGVPEGPPQWAAQGSNL